MARLSRQLLEMLWDLGFEQDGVVAHRQLLGLGFTDDAIGHRLGDRLHPVHRGVYAVGRPGLSRRGRWRAGLLACGDEAALSHESGAALLAIIGDDGGRTHISMPHARHPDHDGIVVHRRTPMPPVVEVDGMPVVDPLFVLLDLAPALAPSRVAALVNEADKLGLLAFDVALERVAELKGRRGVRKLYSVLAAHQATDSDLERRFLRLCETAGIPRPLTQVVIEGHRVDFYWAELGLVVETDGLTYHRTPAQQAADRLRDQQLTAAGLTCLRFTNEQVRREPQRVRDTLAAVIQRLRND